MTSPNPKQSELSAYDLAQQAYEQCGKDTDKAKALLNKWCDDDPVIQHAITGKYRDTIISELISKVVRTNRSHILQSVRNESNQDRLTSDAVTSEQTSNRPNGSNKPRLNAIKNIVSRNWWDYSLPNVNKSLGEATKADLEKSIAFCSGQKKHFEQSEAFLQRLADKTRPNHSVMASLSHSDVDAISKECFKDE